MPTCAYPSYNFFRLWMAFPMGPITNGKKGWEKKWRKRNTSFFKLIWLLRKTYLQVLEKSRTLEGWRFVFWEGWYFQLRNLNPERKNQKICSQILIWGTSTSTATWGGAVVAAAPDSSSRWNGETPRGMSPDPGCWGGTQIIPARYEALGNGGMDFVSKIPVGSLNSRSRMISALQITLQPGTLNNEYQRV